MPSPLRYLLLLAASPALALTRPSTAEGDYLVGRGEPSAASSRRSSPGPTHDALPSAGKADITGPAADVELMGYASPTQIAAGIHTRLYARAFIVADPSDNTTRFAFVNLDACMGAQGVTLAVLRQLKFEFGDLYTEANVALSGTHTHSGPGGYLQYVLYTITSLGFVRESFDVLVSGIVEAVRRAHADLGPGGLRVAAGELLGANANRSPTAYLANPPGERAAYAYDVDKTLTLLALLDSRGRASGAVAWFPVHGTSINNTNALISGDNKGVAAQLVEEWAGTRAPGVNASGSEVPEGVAPGFVAAFGQANVGDTSPNTLGAFCQDTGEPCEKVHSTCGGRNELCIGRGPRWEADDHGHASNEVIAGRQAAKAIQLLRDANQTAARVRGAIAYRHAYVDMRWRRVRASNRTREGRTCPAAMGFSFAAGTTDGPGAFDFKQSDTEGTVFWRVVGHFLKTPTAEQTRCHAPKPILLDTGNVHFPYEWQPAIVDVGVLRVGQLVILAVPGELTTMAGRRLKAAVREQVEAAWGGEAGGVTVVIAGLTNTYSSYVTTWEEYQEQRYEGASTIFGPHTLDAYIQEFVGLAAAMVAGEATEPGPPPPDMVDRQWGFLGPVVLDTVPQGAAFGGLVADVPPRPFWRANETVRAAFHSACPRNNVRLEGTFLAVERLNATSGAWDVVHTDAHRSTRFHWSRPHTLSSESQAAISWTVPPGTPTGTYRLRHFGDYKHILGGTEAFSGASSPFRVGAAAPPLGGWLARLLRKARWRLACLGA